MSNSNFRILSLDGGGIRGFFSAALLAQLEQSTGKSVIDYFDLIVGTSTGAIIALGLAAGLPATDILNFYRHHGNKIFYKANIIRSLFRPKYGNGPLISALKEIFGDKVLNDLKAQVCIASYELVEGWPRVFKDNHHPQLHWGGEKPIWKVAAASSAAPVYFSPFQIDELDCHIDGGVWANNPVMLGVAEAVRYFEQPLDNISVLSLGTGSRTFRLTHAEAASLGIIGWAKDERIISLVLEAQTKSAHTTACMLLKPDNYLRIDADLSDSIPLDNYQMATALIERGAHAGRIHKTKIEEKFLINPRAFFRR